MIYKNDKEEPGQQVCYICGKPVKIGAASKKKYMEITKNSNSNISTSKEMPKFQLAFHYDCILGVSNDGSPDWITRREKARAKMQNLIDSNPAWEEWSWGRLIKTYPEILWLFMPVAKNMDSVSKIQQSK